MTTDIPRPALQTIYAEHHGWLRGWLCRQLGDSAEAADIAQDTFLRLLAKNRSAPADIRNPRAMLAHVAKGLMVDRWRRRDLERAYLETLRLLPPAQQPSAEERLVILETLMQIEQALAQLAPLTRQIFLLAQIDGLTLDQIAGRTGVAAITARRHIRKALLACLGAV